VLVLANVGDAEVQIDPLTLSGFARDAYDLVHDAELDLDEGSPSRRTASSGCGSLRLIRPARSRAGSRQMPTDGRLALAAAADDRPRSAAPLDPIRPGVLNGRRQPRGAPSRGDPSHDRK
jgi:hypothetical protein